VIVIVVVVYGGVFASGRRVNAVREFAERPLGVNLANLQRQATKHVLRKAITSEHS